jgi:hypothetical protein
VRCLDDARVGLARARVPGDALGPMKSLHGVVSDEDVELCSDESERHAVADGVDIDKRVVAYALPQSTMTDGER